MIKFTSKGSFKNSNKYFSRCLSLSETADLKQFGEEGVRALSAATPTDSGNTAASWTYKIIKNKEKIRVEWHNTNTNDSYTVAILLQYGHATKGGGRVEGIDYINPTMKPIFNRMSEKYCMEVREL